MWYMYMTHIGQYNQYNRFAHILCAFTRDHNMIDGLLNLNPILYVLYVFSLLIYRYLL